MIFFSENLKLFRNKKYLKQNHKLYQNYFSNISFADVEHLLAFPIWDYD